LFVFLGVGMLGRVIVTLRSALHTGPIISMYSFSVVVVVHTERYCFVDLVFCLLFCFVKIDFIVEVSGFASLAGTLVLDFRFLPVIFNLFIFN
jgi:hypothetical protein